MGMRIFAFFRLVNFFPNVTLGGRQKLQLLR